MSLIDPLLQILQDILIFEYIIIGLIFASCLKEYNKPIWMRFASVLGWPVILLRFSILGLLDIAKIIINIFKD